MTAKFDELKTKLKEIFQLDEHKPDLDFGIYRIMHARENEITDFLENRLAEKVKAALAGNSAAEKAAYEKDLAEKIAQAKSLNMDPDAVPAVKELRDKISALGNDEDAEAAVYAHLLAFFSRYYDSGDFMSKRRYKDGVYAIPYSGEEVKLYWANADQYYIKSGENFANYDFKLKDGHKIHFSLVTAETAKDNIKDNEAARYFVLWDPSKKEDVEDEKLKKRLPNKFLEEKGGELYIYFQYLKVKKGKNINQSYFLNEASAKILEELKNIHFIEKYNLTTLAPTEKDKNRTVLDKHLAIYSAKNTSDYFIHTDLKGFLTRELDFYIKNEMMHLDDMQSANTFKDIERNLCQIQTIRLIALELIEFMAQLEEFQKKLWLKKKFVVQCNYCITMDRIPKELQSKVLENQAQIEEWKRLGFSKKQTESSKQDELVPNIGKNKENTDFRLVDTKFFDDQFKAELLKSIPDFDLQCDGLLINADNFQALRFLQKRYKNEIQLIYIDPPYNTDASKIYYKNDYEHSSWLSLMSSRLYESRKLMSSSAIIEVAIDDYEMRYLNLCMDQIFGLNNSISNIAILTNPKGRDQDFIAQSHDYTIVYAYNKKLAETHNFVLTDEELSKKFAKSKDGESLRELPLKRTGTGKRREDRPLMYFPFFYNIKNQHLLVIPKEEYKKIYNKGTDSFDDIFVSEIIAEYEKKGYVAILPLDRNGERLRWRWGYESCVNGVNSGVLFCKKIRNGGYAIYQYDFADSEATPKSLWFGEKYDASSKGTNLLDSIIPNNPFDFPKSLYTVEDNIIIGASENDIVLDYFAGSGTTGHAIIDLNRKDCGRRKYILVEMGEHFDTVLKPRIEKIVYSPEWKDGKPLKPEEGISHCFKYMTLESYEDALNNIELERKGDLLDGIKKDEYLLSYMLDIESKGSIINTDDFKHPFDYSLKIAIDSSGASEKRKVDLVETFNYLIGLRVAQYVRQIDKGYCFLDGTLPSGEKTFVLWRDCEKINDDELNKLLAKFGIKPGATEYDVIYVNGDHAIANVKLGVEEGKKLKVRQIENEFLEKMFGESK